MTRGIDQDRRTYRTQPIGQTLPRITRRAFGRKGFGEPRVLTRWREIVGDTLARYTCPERLSFPTGQRGQGTLHLRVDGQYALEIQHLEPMILQRINAFFGYCAVARLAILQAPVAEAHSRRAVRAIRHGPDVSEAAASIAPAMKNPNLRDALARLGRHLVRAPRND